MIKPFAVASVRAFVVSIPREVPYLGPLGEGETVNARGYFVRRSNRTIYPTTDRSIVLRIDAEGGNVGWGETYGIVAPGAVVAIIDDVLAPLLVGRTVLDVPAVWDELYALMRVRGHWSGFFTDALAAVDIALWDLAAKVSGQRVVDLLGGARREHVRAYASGLPRATLNQRVALAQELVGQGYDGVKYAAAVSHEGIVEEMTALRSALGASIDIMVDLHWKFAPTEAISLVRALEPQQPYFVEAPCAPEDIDGQADIARNVNAPIAGGEEWSTVHQAAVRFAHGCVAIVQPEVAHTGISQFVAIAALARARGIQVIPHATIGVGIFHAASLHVAASLESLPYHEHQHSILDSNLRFLETSMHCVNGRFVLPWGAGLGVEPRSSLWAHVVDTAEV